MARRNPKAGEGPCPCCGRPVFFRVSPASQKLAYGCDGCDSSGFADPGGAAHRKWTASITTPAAGDDETPPAGAKPGKTKSAPAAPAPAPAGALPWGNL